jgi:poly(hydroxyalkanoate) granule-associated protein
MAARKKTAKKTTRRASARGSRTPASVIEGVQQIWLAGIGAISKVPSEGPAAFQDAVTEGIKLLNRSRVSAEKLIRDALESAQGSVQSRIGDARDQASDTWDNLETLFQTRVQKALQQLGVPDRHEIRALVDRVAELNDSVRELTGTQSVKKARKKTKAKAKTRAKTKAKTAKRKPTAARPKAKVKAKAKSKSKAKAKAKAKAKSKTARRTGKRAKS